MDYTIDHAINTAVRGHPLLDSILSNFASWGVTLFGVAAFLLWLLDKPRHPGVYRRACAAGLSAAAVALLLNQIISHFWHRARPYEAHPRGVLPLIAGSHDPSFPSDHATAAFAIAFGVLFVALRAGLLFLAWATLIALSRVLVGVHYPTDILASLPVGIIAGFICARTLMPMLDRLIALAGRVTDPILERIEASPLIHASLGSPHFRSRAAAVIGVVLLTGFAGQMGGPILDELPLAALALGALIVLGASRLAGLQPPDRRNTAPRQPTGLRPRPGDEA